MLSQQALLSVLSDGEWHSGEDLGAHFNVSRAAIWKQLKQLQTAGIALESERGRAIVLLTLCNYSMPMPLKRGLPSKPIRCSAISISNSLFPLPIAQLCSLLSKSVMMPITAAIHYSPNNKPLVAAVGGVHGLVLWGVISTAQRSGASLPALLDCLGLVLRSVSLS